MRTASATTPTIHHLAVFLSLLLFSPIFQIHASPPPPPLSYVLLYDALVSPSTVQQHSVLPENNHPDDQPHSSLIPPTIAVETTQTLGSTLFGRWVDYKYARGERTVFGVGGSVPLGLNCLPQEVSVSSGDKDGVLKEEAVMVSGTVCSMDHTSPGFSFQITTTLYRAHGSLEDYGFVVLEDDGSGGENNSNGEIDNVKNNDIDTADDTKSEGTADNDVDDDDITGAAGDNPPKDDTTTTNNNNNHQDVPVAIRIDITVTAQTQSSSSYARDTLIELIPTITTTVHATSQPVSPLWTIAERPTIARTFYQRLQQHHDHQISRRRRQHRKHASLETLVLSDPQPVVRIPLVSSSQNTRLKRTTSANSSSSSAVQTSSIPNQSLHPHLDIWHIQSSLYVPSHRSLFLRSVLRATTAPYGKAHSDAFVRPVMETLVRRKKKNGSSSLTNVLVLSEMPLGYLRGILRYETVGMVRLVGVDERALGVGRDIIPALDDCRDGRRTYSAVVDAPTERCLDDERVGIMDYERLLQYDVEEAGDTTMECVVEEEKQEEERCGSTKSIGEGYDNKNDKSNNVGKDEEERGKGTKKYTGSLPPPTRFDVVFIDASFYETTTTTTTNSNNNFDNDDQRRLFRSVHEVIRQTITEDAIVVVNDGEGVLSLTASLGEQRRSEGGRVFREDGGIIEMEKEQEENFLVMSTTPKEDGGLGYGFAQAYNEPLAAPLDAAFFVLYASHETTALINEHDY